MRHSILLEAHKKKSQDTNKEIWNFIHFWAYLILLCQWHAIWNLMKTEFDEHVIVKRKKEIFLINLRRSAHAMRLKETNALKC